MKRIEEQMAFYEAYHRNPVNKLTHFVGIPAIVFSLLVLFSSVSVSVVNMTITPAMVLVGILLAYYFLLQPAFGFGMALFLLPALDAAHRIGHQSWTAIAALFLTFFVGGWVF
jgi:uncharacterized membrane protein YGL010W